MVIGKEIDQIVEKEIMIVTEDMDETGYFRKSGFQGRNRGNFRRHFIRDREERSPWRE